MCCVSSGTLMPSSQSVVAGIQGRLSFSANPLSSLWCSNMLKRIWMEEKGILDLVWVVSHQYRMCFLVYARLNNIAQVSQHSHKWELLWLKEVFPSIRSVAFHADFGFPSDWSRNLHVLASHFRVEFSHLSQAWVSERFCICGIFPPEDAHNIKNMLASMANAYQLFYAYGFTGVGACGVLSSTCPVDKLKNLSIFRKWHSGDSWICGICPENFLDSD